MFDGWGGWEAKSAGTALALGRNPLTQNLIDWAHLILVMEPVHSQFIHTKFKCDPNKVRVLDVSNNYVSNDPEPT